MAIVLRAVFTGLPRDIDDGRGAPWRSGFFKSPQVEAVQLATGGLEGDGQADLSVHGGPEKAALGYCTAHYHAWRTELGRDDLVAGAFGENLLFDGLDEESAMVGDRYRVGDAVIAVSQPRQPCWKLARRCGLPTMPALAIANGRLGWYFRVAAPGAIQAGARVELVDRPNPGWSIARINRIFFAASDEARQLLTEVLRLPGLSPEFAAICAKRFPPG